MSEALSLTFFFNVVKTSGRVRFGEIGLRRVLYDKRDLFPVGDSCPSLRKSGPSQRFFFLFWHLLNKEFPQESLQFFAQLVIPEDVFGS